MKLEIRNIGRVEKADIELQGITVVAGANGTGKNGNLTDYSIEGTK